MQEILIHPFDQLPTPSPISQAGKALDEIDGYICSPADRADIDRQWPQLKALFMIDGDRIVQWVDIECQSEGLAGIGKMPSENVILQAASALLH